MLDGGCACRAVRYRLTTAPIIVHCCHCRWCQRETGASFALNAMIESDRVLLLHGDVELVQTPSESGKGQKIARCPKCRIALWSHYSGAGDAVSFVRVGTLDSRGAPPCALILPGGFNSGWGGCPRAGTAQRLRCSGGKSKLLGTARAR